MFASWILYSDWSEGVDEFSIAAALRGVPAAQVTGFKRLGFYGNSELLLWWIFFCVLTTWNSEKVTSHFVIFF